MSNSFRTAGNRTHFRIHSRTTRYQGFFRIDRYRLQHKLFGGGWTPAISREIFERGHAAAVLLYDPLRDEIVLLEQFRIGALTAKGGPWLTEIVAGMIEVGEEAEQVARREAEEEAGCVIEALLPICDYLVSPGGTSERITLFCGKVDSSRAGGIHGLASESEDIHVTTVSYHDAVSMINDGQINSASPIIALQWLQLNRDRVRTQWL